MAPSSSGRFLNELRRRRVPQTLGLYLVVGFGVLEAADIAFPRLGLPDWTVTLVLALLLLGIPLVAIGAWVFDVTRRGLERTVPPVPDDSDEGRSTDSGAWTGIGRVAALGVVAAMVVGAGAYALGPGFERSEDSLRADLVAVLPFRATGDAEPLSEGMLDLMAAKLTGEGGLRALEPRAVLAAWRDAGGGQPGTGDAVPDAVARKLGAGRFVLGSAVRSGDRLHLAGRVHATVGSQELARFEIEGRADSLPALVDRFAAGLLTQLAGVDESRMPQLEHRPLPALRAYLEGHAELRAGSFEASAAAFERALRVDSTFALSGLFHRIATSFTLDQSEHGALLARRHADQLSQRDRFMLDRWIGVDADWQTRAEHLEGLREVTRAIPDRAEAWYLRGDYEYHFAVFEPLPVRLDQAARSFETAVGLDRNFAPAAIHLLEIALFRGDTASAREIAADLLENAPEGEIAGYVSWFAGGLGLTRSAAAPAESFWSMFPAQMATQHGFGLERADALIERVLPSLSDADRSLLDFVATYLNDRGRPARARELDRERAMLPTGSAELRRLYAGLYWETGDPEDTLQVLAERFDRAAESGQSLDDVSWLEAACLSGQFHAAHGDPRLARRRADSLEAAQPDRSALGRYAAGCSAVIHGLLATRAPSGVPDEVANRLDTMHADGVIAEPRLRAAATLVLARLYEQRGELGRALEATRRRVVAVPWTAFSSTQLREEGRIAASLGRTDEAVRAYDHYLRLRSDPEPAVEPYVEQVRRELARLTEETSPR